MLRNIVVRLVVYYVAWAAFLSGVYRLFPGVLFYVAQERNRFLVGTSSSGFEASEFLEQMQQVPGRPDGAQSLFDGKGAFNQLVDPAITIPVLVALILAFAVTLPIAWVYQWTRPRKKHNQSFLHALLVTPIGIALVVFLVKGSLPLAFGLAGIVAAVRFRATIKEPMDAVYMLMVIGIGLASGTQLTVVAFLASLSFVGITLAVWKSNYGAQPTRLSGWSIVPPEAQTQASDTGGQRKAGKRPG